MTFGAFERSLANAAPDAMLSAPLRALWYAHKGDWDAAHRLVQDESSRDAAWVHAHLHRVEGDLDNARYWYGRAGRKTSNAEIAAEWREMCEALLGAAAT